MPDVLFWLLVSLAINVCIDILAIPVTFVGYLVYTGLERAREQMQQDYPPLVKALASGALWIGIRGDLWLNYSLGPKLFLRFPPLKCWTLSKTMTHYWDTEPRDSRRNRIIAIIKRVTWIDVFDPSGLHIGSSP